MATFPSPVKKTVDEVVDKLEELPVVRVCYDQWCSAPRRGGELLPRQTQRDGKSCPRRKSSGRSKTLSFRRRSASGLGEITFEDDGMISN